MSDKFEKETELCAAFIGAIDKREWTPYAETGGFDIVLARKRDGFQIGIQAKLRFNMDVLLQIIQADYWADISMPNCRAILVPGYAVDRGLGAITDYIGITLIRQDKTGGFNRAPMFRPDLPKAEMRSWRQEDWFELCPEKPIKLPDYVPDYHLAGASAPVQLTEWKIKTIKLAIILEKRGHILRSDFKHLNLDHRRFFAVENRWLQLLNGKIVAGPAFPPVKKQHPDSYQKIKADYPKWKPPATLI